MKRQTPETVEADDSDYDDVPPDMSAHIEYLSRRWADEEERQSRQPRRGPTRRYIEDWREEQELRRAFDDELDLD